MSKQGIGIVIGTLGVLALIAATVKFMTGFYADEALPWLAVLAAGAVLAGLGQKLFTAGRSEGMK